MNKRTSLPINRLSVVTTLTVIAFILIAITIESAAAENVAWTNLIYATATGNSVQQSGCEYCTGGATSQQQIAAGDGYLEFTAAETTTIRYAGLGPGNAGNNYAAISFAIRLAPPNSVEV